MKNIVQVIAPTYPVWKVWARELTAGYFTERVHLWVVWEEIEHQGEFDETTNHMVGDEPCSRDTNCLGCSISDIKECSWVFEPHGFLGYEEQDPEMWDEDTKKSWQQQAEEYLVFQKQRRASKKVS